MKSIVKATAVALVLCGAIIVFGCAIIPKTVNIPVVNQTGVTITDVYIRDAGTADWGTVSNKKARFYNGQYVRDWDGNMKTKS